MELHFSGRVEERFFSQPYIVLGVEQDVLAWQRISASTSRVRRPS